MGYMTEFKGQIKIDPPLSTEEIAFLTKFAETRRMSRKNGPYFVDGSGEFGQGHDDDILDYNNPPEGQPNLWCSWVPTSDGSSIEWSGAEKFYEAEKWMQYLIDHFLRPGRYAWMLPFLQDHTCNGSILAQGEDIGDRWKLIVTDNQVSVQNM